MIDKAHITKTLKDNKLDLLTRYHLTSIGIFGSFTREDFQEDSDIDILIEMPRGTEHIYDKKNQLREFLKKQFNREIDICRESAIKPLFKDLILKDAIYV